MAIADMEVRVGADISGLLSKVDQAKAKIGQLTEEQGRLKDQVKDLNYAMRANDKAYRDLEKRLAAVNRSTAEGRDLARQLKKEMRGLVQGNIQYDGELKHVQKSLVDNNTQLKVHSANLKKVKSAGSGALKGASKLVTGLRSLAYIIPGLGIAGLVSLIAGPVINAFSEWVKSVDKAEEASKRLANVIGGAESQYTKAISNVSQLKDEIELAKKGFISKEGVVKHYNETIGKTTGFVKDLEEAEKSLQRNAQAYVQMTLYKAAAEIAGGEAAKKAYEAMRTSREKLEKFENTLDRSNQFNITSEQDAKRATEQIKRNATARKNAKIKIATDEQNELLKIQKAFNDSAAAISKGFGFNFNQDNTADKGGASAKNKVKELETVNDVIEKLRLQIDFLNKKEILTGTSQAQQRIKAIEGTIDTLLNKFKLLADDPIVINLQARIDGIKADEFMREFTKKLQKEFKETKVDVPVDLNPQKPTVTFEPGWSDEKVLKDQILKELKRRGITKTAPIQVGIDVEGNAIMAGGMLITGAEGWETLLNTLKASNEQFEKMIDITSGTLGPAFDALFTGILTGSQDAFRGFGEALNQTMVQIAAAILKAAALALILSSINPAGGGFGSIFKKLTGFKDGGHVKGFADGGHIKGPGTGRSDSIMARLSHGEYVIPAHIVSKFGVNFFDKIRKGMKPGFDQFGIPKFANGGFVSPNIIRTARAANISSGSIGGGQVIQVTGNFELRNDKLVAAVSRGRDKINRNS